MEVFSVESWTLIVSNSSAHCPCNECVHRNYCEGISFILFGKQFLSETLSIVDAKSRFEVRLVRKM